MAPADEDLAVAVEAVRLDARGEEGSSRAKDRLGLDRSVRAVACDDVLRPVEVVEVVDGVGEAELDVAEATQVPPPLAAVAYAQDPELAGAVVGLRCRRNEVENLALDAAERARDLRVGGAVPALVGVEVATGRLPGRAPEIARLLIAQVEVAAGLVGGNGVVAVAADAPVARVAVEGVAACGIGDDSAVAACAQVIDPGSGRIGARDHVFARVLVEVAVWIQSELTCLGLEVIA